MATDDEKREMANGLVLGAVMLAVTVFAWCICGWICRATHYAPEPNLSGGVQIVEDQ